MEYKKTKSYDAPVIKKQAMRSEMPFALSLPIVGDNPPVDPGTAEIGEETPKFTMHNLWDEEETE